MGAAGIGKRMVVVQKIKGGKNLTYTAATDEHGRFIYDEGVMCYEAKEDGTLTLYVDRGDGESVEVMIPAHDVRRLLTAAVDAVSKEAGRR